MNSLKFPHLEKILYEQRFSAVCSENLNMMLVLVKKNLIFFHQMNFFLIHNCISNKNLLQMEYLAAHKEKVLNALLIIKKRERLLDELEQFVSDFNDMKISQLKSQTSFLLILSHSLSKKNFKNSKFQAQISEINPKNSKNQHKNHTIHKTSS